MTINGRLLLLVAATGLFVRVWTANDRAHHLRTGNRVAQFAVSPTVSGREWACDATYRPTSTRTRGTAALEEVWTSVSSPVPLPAGIQSGVYRVASDTGRVARLEIAAPLAAAANASNAPEFWMTTFDSQQWYFIRLHASERQQQTVAKAPPAVNAVSAQTGLGNVPSPCMNRKFDFTGYVTTNPVENVESESPPPDSPDMPFPL
jgi:hypothetical protein